MGHLPPPLPLLLMCLAISTWRTPSVSGYLNIFISHLEVMKLMDRAKAKFPNPTHSHSHSHCHFSDGSYTDFIDVPRRNGLVLVVWLAIFLLLRLINGSREWKWLVGVGSGNSDEGFLRKLA
ncbi:hypothetical protein M5D96_008310 [Drosophila gunungcola]|uniref:Uncharacterized protein n=1 Tax=Drosophila gunungcola TaxID=103775 RepID=A0A9P9YK28_9MUSC|nr:hypothetical protein M5D96_008310 [Drosophila gunungcola]